MITCSKCGTQYGGGEVFCPQDGTRLIAGTDRHKLVSVPPVGSDTLIGKIIQNRYKVLKLLGAGGMGVVYVAVHVEIEKEVALKVLRDDFSKRPEVVERFRQEARAASKIGNPHIVDVTDFGQLDDGGVYFTMEYLRGESLSEVMYEKTLAVEAAVPIVVQIARALQAAHDLGIVHRDLKPENVFLVEREDQKNFVKVLDFGIAKISDRDSEGKRLTQTGMIFGTPEYMSPEQAMGKPLDHRVDIYALGCIMFEMFVGRVPYDGDSFMAVLTQHMFEPVPLIEEANPQTDVPVSIRNIVYRAMAKDVKDRYENMADLEADLLAAYSDADYVVTQPTNMAPGPPGMRGTSPGSASETTMDWSASSETVVARPGIKKRVLVGGIAGFTVIALVLFIFGTFFNEKPDRVVATPAVTSVEQTSGGHSEPLADSAKTSQASQGKAIKNSEAAPDTNDETQKGVSLKVSVKIQSNPEGATLLIDGLGQVCSATPCELDLDVGKPVKFEAKLGRKRAEMTFTPSSQNKTLMLKLKGGGSRPPGKNTGNKTPKPQKNNNASELKIPGIFQDN